MQTVGRFDMWLAPYTGILTLVKLKYFMSKDLSTKTLQSCTAANNTKRDSERGTRNIVWKRLNQICLYKNFIKIWIFDDSDETEISLPLLNGLNILEYI